MRVGADHAPAAEGAAAGGGRGGRGGGGGGGGRGGRGAGGAVAQAVPGVPQPFRRPSAERIPARADARFDRRWPSRGGGGGGSAAAVDSADPGPYVMPGTYTVALTSRHGKVLDSKPLKIVFDPDVQFAAGEHERYNAIVTDLHSLQRAASRQRVR